MTYTFVLSLEGTMVSGKNQTKTVYPHGKAVKIPNQRFKSWRERMHAQLAQQHVSARRAGQFPLMGLLSLTIDYWPEDACRRDATGMCDAIFHLLERAQVVQNDSQIKRLHFVEHARRDRVGQLTLTLEDWRPT